MNKLNPDVSVVVPVYNAEKYISQCICSIVNQTYKNIEIILVDDGSTDGSAKICDEFSEKDTRVTVIHKKNAGVSSARNTALGIAKGKYLQFVDSDDYIHEDMIEQLMKYRSDADIIISDYYKVSGGVTEVKRQIVTGDIIDDMMSGNVIGSPWNKFIKRKCVVDSGVSFNDELDFCEDICFFSDIALHYDRKIKIKHLPSAFYYYNMQNPSLTRRPVLEYKDSIVKYVDYLSKRLNNPQKYLFISNKFGLKWAMLKGNIGWQEYKATYPEIFALLHLPQAKNYSSLKLFIVGITKYRIPFHIIQKILSSTAWILSVLKNVRTRCMFLS